MNTNNNFGSFPAPQGLPPIQTLVRPDQILKLANLPEERKPSYIQGVTGLWERLKNNPPDSQEYHDAYRRLHEASENLKRTMNQARATQNAPRPNNPTQPAQPAEVRQPVQSGGQRPPGPTEQFSQKVLDNVRKQAFFVPADVAALGPQRAQAWQREMKQKYAMTLQKFETSQIKLQELNILLQNKEGKTITPAEEHSLNSFKTDHEKTIHQAREYLTLFRQNQDRIRVIQKQAATVNPSGADAARMAGATGSSAEHPQSILEPQNSHANTGANTVSDHQGQTHTVSSALDAARNHPSAVGRPALSVESGGQVNQATITQAATTQAPEGQAAAASEHSQTNQNMNRTSGAAPPFHSPASTNPPSTMPPGPHPLSHQAAISQSQSARSYSQHTNQNPAVQTSTHAHPQTRDPQNNNTKMPIPKDLKVAQPQPVAMGPARPTLTGGPSNGAAGPMGQPAIQKHPGYVLEGDGERVLGRKQLEDLVRQVTGGVDGEVGETLNAAAEETLLDVADDFVDQVVTAACKLAKLRSSQILELRDIQLVLERNYNIRIPGYASDELRTVKKVQPTPGWTQKLAAVQAAKVTGGKGDI
ncbi:MAG: hypothetical protein Q9202_000194 [Teloschistes flavicans]